MNLSLKDRSAGFYFAAVLVLLNIVAAVVYAVGYNGSRYMSWLVFCIFAAVAVVGIVLFFVGKLQYFATVSYVGSLIGIGAFVLAVFNYLVDAFVGIDVASFSAEFIACTILFVVILAGSFLCNMMRVR